MRKVPPPQIRASQPMIRRMFPRTVTCPVICQAPLGKYSVDLPESIAFCTASVQSTGLRCPMVGTPPYLLQAQVFMAMGLE